MSTDLIVLFDWQNPEATPEWLCERLSADPAELKLVIERYRRRWRVQAWECTRSSDERTELLGPGGFSINFRHHIVEIYHVVPFHIFASDGDVRAPLQRVWRWFSNQLGSSCAIYTHEIMPYSGSNLSQIAKGVEIEIGPPACDFAELARAEYFGPKAWYVDKFSDQGNVRGPSDA